MKCYKITISGDVIRKGFRFTAMQMAYKQGINGFVKYKDKDLGSVIIEAEGKDESVENFIEWCRKGPTWAKVSTVSTEEVEIKGYHSFDILHLKYRKSEPESQDHQEKRARTLFGSFLMNLDHSLQGS